MRRIRLFFLLLRYLGPRWLFQRLFYMIELRLGIIERKTPALPWQSYPLSAFLQDPSLAHPSAYWQHRQKNSPRFFFSTKNRKNYQVILQQWPNGPLDAVTVAKALEQGNILYFNYKFVETGLPPEWHHNAISGESIPADLHWSRIPDFGFGDIKVVWEPNRFAFVYHLVRAYWRTGNERNAELFWSLVEDWRIQNPPNRGANWKCGQETTFRVMAWIFGLYGFADAQATTPERVALLAEMIAVSGQRIEANIQYALNQRNNHSISEGVGLWTIGLLFPEFRQAQRWREKGRQILESLGKELIYDDGSFVQHSVNYHRLVLHDFIWAIRLGEINQYPFSEMLKNRIALAETFLFQLQDSFTGQTPYYGQNDGALILPLNNCDYLDFRPVIQATHYLIHHQRRFESGLWDEELLWLFGPEALQAPRDNLQPSDFKATTGGYYTFRSKESLLFIRCATFRHRPGQADMLHVDLWWNGQNIAADAGTYSYNAPPPWNNPFAKTSFHNTVTVDGFDQMDRAGKFLWLPWLHSTVRYDESSPKNLMHYWEGQHDGYQRLSDPVLHCRAILQLPDEAWLIIDDLRGTTSHNYRLHWLFPDYPYQWSSKTGHLQLHTESGTFHVLVQTSVETPEWSLVKNDEISPRGWRAPYYTARQPAISLALTGQSSAVQFLTLFSSKPATMKLSLNVIEIKQSSGNTLIHLSNDENKPLINTVRLAGAIDTIWELN